MQHIPKETPEQELKIKLQELVTRLKNTNKTTYTDDYAYQKGFQNDLAAAAEEIEKIIN